MSADLSGASHTWLEHATEPTRAELAWESSVEIGGWGILGGCFKYLKTFSFLPSFLTRCFLSKTKINGTRIPEATKKVVVALPTFKRHPWRKMSLELSQTRYMGASVEAPRLWLPSSAVTGPRRKRCQKTHQRKKTLQKGLHHKNYRL